MPHPCLQAAQDAKHDLGKYVAFQIRWLPPDASADALLEALRADVLHTRRGPDGSESAPEIWLRHRPALAPLGPRDPDIAAVDAAVAALAAAAPALESGAIDAGALRAAADHARAIARHLAALVKRLRT